MPFHKQRPLIQGLVLFLHSSILHFFNMKSIKIIFAFLASASLLFSCQQEEILTAPDASALAAASSDELQIDPAEGLLDEAALYALLADEQELSSRTSPQSAVYTIGNEVAANQVIAFYRNPDGSLYEAGRYDTGGTGTGGGLGNQAALAISSGGKFLYVVNPGSNDISHFLIKNDGSLELKNKIASGGTLPVSIAVHNGLVYVLNAGGTGNITGFAFNQQGQIFQLSNSTRALSSPTAGAAQVAFSPNGRALVVTEKATNIISSFGVLSNGRPTAIRTFPAANATPFGFAFGHNGNFHVSEAAGGAAGASTISTYHVNVNGQVSLVDGPFALNQSAACWVAMAKNNSLLFSTNTGSNNISTLDVSFFGYLSAPAVGGTTVAMSQPLDAAVDKDSDHLYVLLNGNNAIISYTFNSNGVLTQIDLDDQNLPDRMSGLVVRG